MVTKLKSPKLSQTYLPITKPSLTLTSGKSIVGMPPITSDLLLMEKLDLFKKKNLLPEELSLVTEQLEIGEMMLLNLLSKFLISLILLVSKLKITLQKELETNLGVSLTSKSY